MCVSPWQGSETGEQLAARKRAYFPPPATLYSVNIDLGGGGGKGEGEEKELHATTQVSQAITFSRELILITALYMESVGELGEHLREKGELPASPFSSSLSSTFLPKTWRTGTVIKSRLLLEKLAAGGETFLCSFAMPYFPQNMQWRWLPACKI